MRSTLLSPSKASKHKPKHDGSGGVELRERIFFITHPQPMRSSICTVARDLPEPFINITDERVTLGFSSILPGSWSLIPQRNCHDTKRPLQFCISDSHTHRTCKALLAITQSVKRLFVELCDDL
ncbi:hypothetical protein, unlikely [Trypanosoma brucei gambiense DAL972]|uniref:Uncharacterized protein n=1 Tax=Trypanosoma brucei gambiense (strain MHOM/CI/86/DAL972) TaxID=679716 RepID=C9ZN25_TRYB9|nr:hypothetical protein, unlikely [Trypanosoma brucei gambiense DAL972]CBH10679.1 hypothetical protein, unlikely [Trypanosoma brucei gambiense DAL972]|eukprot:XP_011772967.1 hypothetical protein, unlikely [Trypanosoma brucei gambiense DAL972]